MITPSFNLTATERVLPKLALDFTTASLDSRVTFTRTTNSSNPATYTNSNGYIVTASNNQPRFDYNPITLTCKGLLIEEPRSNLIIQTQSFNTSWGYTNILPFGSGSVVNAINGPDGLQTADFIVPTTTLATHSINANIIGGVVNATTTGSIYLKPGGYNFVRIQLSSSTSNPVVYFNISTGEKGTIIANSGTVVDSKIEPVGNGWYRCSVSATPSSGTAFTKFILQISDVDNGGSFAGDGTSGVYFWGAQVETGAFPTSYMPATTSLVTRNADVATMTGSNFSSWWTATTGASDIWLIPKSTTTLAYMSFDDNTTNNKIIIANNATSGQSTITSGGTLQATLTSGTITVNATNKIGCSWNTNNCAATANATTPATTASATIPTVTQLRIGNNGTAYANAWIQKLFYWPQRITNNEIQSFTK